MAESASALGATLIADQETAVENVVETTPLLKDTTAQERSRRLSSVVGDTHQGFHVIPGETPDEIPRHSARAVLATLSVLLVGMDMPPSTLSYPQC
jgi:hypothetical protein